MEKPKHILHIFCFILILLLTSCTLGNRTTQLTPITVQLAWTHQSQFAGLYAADQLGYFSDEGLSVSFLEGGSNYDKHTPVLDGTAQFGIGGAAELILMRSEENSLKAIATIFRRTPIVFISLEEKNITSPYDFVGKTIRASANVAPTLNAMMAKLEINPNQYHYVDPTSNLDTFASGEIPIWGVFRNSLGVTIEDAGYELNYVFPDDYGVHFYADTLFTTDELIDTDPDLVLRFTRAALRGWQYAVENPDKIPEMVLPYNPEADLVLEEHRIIATIPLVNTGEDHIGWMDVKVWTDMEKIFREQGLITHPVDVQQLYTMQFLETIYK